MKGVIKGKFYFYLDGALLEGGALLEVIQDQKQTKGQLWENLGPTTQL